MTKKNDGKSAEGLVRDALKLMQEKVKFTFVRLYDTTSAGSYLPEQPGDFILHFEGRGCLLEVKSSTRHKSLKDCAIRSVFSSSQILGARLWVRSGAKAICLFHSVGTKFIEVWDMNDVVDIDLAFPRKRKLNSSPLSVIPIKDTELMSGLLSVLTDKGN